MTPQEKAKELFKSMYNKIFDIDMGANVMQDKKRFDAAKKCALIVVNEIIENNYNLMDSMKYHEELNYWQEVKTEIEGL